MAQGLIFTIVYICLLRVSGPPMLSAAIALVSTELLLVLLCVSIKTALVGREWGADHLTPFWSWRHFAYFFAQDCFFTWCRDVLGFCAGTILSNPILRWMGCQIGQRTITTQPMQCSDWNAVASATTLLSMMCCSFTPSRTGLFKVKRTRIQNGCAICFGATAMGGAIIERDTTLLPLSLVLKEIRLPTATYEGSLAEPSSVSN